MAYDLEFEKPLAELEKKITGLQRKGDRLKLEEHLQLQDAERELRRRTEEIYSRLSAWQTVQVARHKDRPYSADYIQLIRSEEHTSELQSQSNLVCRLLLDKKT